MLVPNSGDGLARIDEFAADAVLPRHRHWHGYASVILAGRFSEASFCGLAPAQPGDVLLHGGYDRHCDFGEGAGRKIQILRLPWTDDHLEGHFRIDDPDALVRLAENDPRAAVEALAREIRPAPAADPHWTHRLAMALRSDS